MEVELLDVAIYDEGPFPECHDDAYYVSPTVFETVPTIRTVSISAYLMQMRREGAFGLVFAFMRDAEGVGLVGHSITVTVHVEELRGRGYICRAGVLDLL